MQYDFMAQYGWITNISFSPYSKHISGKFDSEPYFDTSLWLWLCANFVTVKDVEFDKSGIWTWDSSRKFKSGQVTNDTL